MKNTYTIGELLVVRDPYYNILKVIKVSPLYRGEVRVDFKSIFGPKHPENYRFFNSKSGMAKDVGKMNEVTKVKYSFIKDIFNKESSFWDDE